MLSDAEQITDAGLRHSERLPTSKVANRSEPLSPRAPDAIESLQRALPSCRIEIGDGLDKKPELAIVD